MMDIIRTLIGLWPVWLMIAFLFIAACVISTRYFDVDCDGYRGFMSWWVGYRCDEVCGGRIDRCCPDRYMSLLSEVCDGDRR